MIFQTIHQTETNILNTNMNKLIFFKIWKKRWIVVRRPYVFIYRDEKDPCERGIINLAQAKTEYTKDQQQLVKNTFR